MFTDRYESLMFECRRADNELKLALLCLESLDLLPQSSDRDMFIREHEDHVMYLEQLVSDLDSEMQELDMEDLRREHIKLERELDHDRI